LTIHDLRKLPDASTAASGDDWGDEIQLDLTMAHALAPKAKLHLVMANSSLASDMRAALAAAIAVPGVTAVSMSYAWSLNVGPDAGSRFAQENLFDAGVKAGIAFFAASGDDGNFNNVLPSGYTTGVCYPAASPYATAVGGTTITALGYRSSGAETGWQFSGGGGAVYGGVSVVRPEYQKAILAASGAPGGQSDSTGALVRAVPDVSAVADPRHSPVSVYREQSWLGFGGTSGHRRAPRAVRAAARPVARGRDSIQDLRFQRAVVSTGLHGRPRLLPGRRR
jgi:subtilase family serine protease